MNKNRISKKREIKHCVGVNRLNSGSRSVAKPNNSPCLQSDTLNLVNLTPFGWYCLMEVELGKLWNRGDENFVDPIFSNAEYAKESFLAWQADKKPNVLNEKLLTQNLWPGRWPLSAIFKSHKRAVTGDH